MIDLFVLVINRKRRRKLVKHQVRTIRVGFLFTSAIEYNYQMLKAIDHRSREGNLRRGIDFRESGKVDYEDTAQKFSSHSKWLVVRYITEQSRSCPNHFGNLGSLDRME